MQRSAFFSDSLHCGRILTNGLSFDSHVFLQSSKEMEEEVEGEIQNVICSLDYVNVGRYIGTNVQSYTKFQS